MLSITFKRSAATLGVVAGLLAAAGPASAAGPAGVPPQVPNDALVTAPTNAWPSKVEISALTGSQAPRANSSEVAVESLTQARNLNDIEAIDFNTLGTQVGSEGVKAHTRLEWPLIDY